MGEVLAMIRAPALLLAATAWLAACGNDEADQSSVDLLLDVLPLPSEQEEAVPDARAVLTPALLAGSPTSVLLAVPRIRGVGYTLIPQAVNGDAVQWIDAAGGAMIRRDGILIGTRGLGFDLHTAEIAALSAALRSGGARDVLRVNRVLTGDNEIVVRRYLCDVVPVRRETLDIYGRRDSTTVYEERCEGDGPGFVNTFWLRDDGLIVRAAERVSPETGIVELTLVAE
jgi:hypothetical protein